MALNDIAGMVNFQTDYVMELAKIGDYGYDLDNAKLFHDWIANKVKDVVGYRDQPHYSAFTNTATPAHHTKWWEARDDSKEAFLEGY